MVNGQWRANNFVDPDTYHLLDPCNWEFCELMLAWLAAGGRGFETRELCFMEQHPKQARFLKLRELRVGGAVSPLRFKNMGSRCSDSVESRPLGKSAPTTPTCYSHSVSTTTSCCEPLNRRPATCISVEVAASRCTCLGKHTQSKVRSVQLGRCVHSKVACLQLGGFLRVPERAKP